MINQLSNCYKTFKFANNSFLDVFVNMLLGLFLVQFCNIYCYFVIKIQRKFTIVCHLSILEM